MVEVEDSESLVVWGIFHIIVLYAMMIIIIPIQSCGWRLADWLTLLIRVDTTTERECKALGWSILDWTDDLLLATRKKVYGEWSMECSAGFTASWNWFSTSLLLIIKQNWRTQKWKETIVDFPWVLRTKFTLSHVNLPVLGSVVLPMIVFVFHNRWISVFPVD